MLALSMQITQLENYVCQVDTQLCNTRVTHFPHNLPTTTGLVPGQERRYLGFLGINVGSDFSSRFYLLDEGKAVTNHKQV